MNNEQLKKLHKEKNTEAINENLYKANIKLVDMNRYLKIDIEKLQQRIDKAIEILDIYGTSNYETADLLYSVLRGSDKE